MQASMTIKARSLVGTAGIDYVSATLTARILSAKASGPSGRRTVFGLMTLSEASQQRSDCASTTNCIPGIGPGGRGMRLTGEF
jgi:hypothetical protein